MTFKQLQDRVLERLNLSSTEARARVKSFLNERLRQAQTSVGLQHVRLTTVTVDTVADTATVTPSGLVKPITIVIPAHGRTLNYRSLDQMRTADPSNTWKGLPDAWAIKSVSATGMTLQLLPIPDAIYALQIDGIATGTDMSEDEDVPGLPEDFHDLLLRGALADELEHQRQTDDALVQEAKFDKRLKDLRYFIAKSIYRHRTQGDAAEWWLHGTRWALPS